MYPNTQDMDPDMHLPNLHASHLCVGQKVLVRWKVVISYKP